MRVRFRRPRRWQCVECLGGRTLLRCSRMCRAASRRSVALARLQPRQRLEHGPPQLGAKSSDKEASAKLGFPSTATATRSGSAAATRPPTPRAWPAPLFPATGGAARPPPWCSSTRTTGRARSPPASWRGSPIGAPMLLTDGGNLPPVTQDTLNRLKPKGSDLSKDAQVIRIGRDTGRPSRLPQRGDRGQGPVRAGRRDRPLLLGGRAASRRQRRDRRRASTPSRRCRRRRGPPARATPSSPSSASRFPETIKKALKEHDKPNIYVLGPGEGDRQGRAQAARQPLGKTRAAHPGRHAGGERDRLRPLPAGQLRLGRDRPRATTSRSPARAGRWTPPRRPRSPQGACSRRCSSPTTRTSSPARSSSYFLSVQPGYDGTPDQAVYNRVWILGDDKVVSVDEQAQVDQHHRARSRCRPTRPRIGCRAA